MSPAALSRAVDLLVRQVGHWQPARWSLTAGDGGTRADVVHRLVQHIADMAADAEGQPRRDVPRLDNDMVLPDQLRVVTADLLAANAPDAVLSAAADQVDAIRHSL